MLSEESHWQLFKHFLYIYIHFVFVLMQVIIFTLNDFLLRKQNVQIPKIIETAKAPSK